MSLMPILPSPPPHDPDVDAKALDMACRAFYDAAGVHWDTLSKHDQRFARQCMWAAVNGFIDVISDEVSH